MGSTRCCSARPPSTSRRGGGRAAGTPCASMPSPLPCRLWKVSGSGEPRGGKRQMATLGPPLLKRVLKGQKPSKWRGEQQRERQGGHVLAA